MVEDLLPEFGIDKERFRFEWISASEGEKFQKTMEEFTETVKSKGPLKRTVPSSTDTAKSTAKT